MRKRFSRLVMLIIFLIFGGYLIFNGYINYLKSPVDKSAEVEAFVVEKGDSASSIADKLVKEKFIRSSWIFKYLYKSSGSPVIEAGDYKISKSMSTDEIIKTLSSGSVDKWTTLIEGWRVEEEAQKLNDQLGIKKEDFLKLAKEGYMFPDTYLFNPDATAETIASTLKNTFDKKYTVELQSKIKSKGLTPEQGVILASLVEREGRSDKVRTEVAGILLKRLKIGMKLDVDATVQYAKDSIALKKNGSVDKFWKPISRDDYSGVISPFNTYLNNGLPPAPICNPSLASLTAVANADTNSPYLYYYHDLAGNSYYAKTLEEHNANVANHR